MAAGYWLRQLEEFLQPLLLQLDQQLDKRLVRTFLQLMQVIISFRHSTQGLLLSELGGYLLTPQHAPAGTKRIGNLLRSVKWEAKAIETFLWGKAVQTQQELEAQGKKAWLIWDESEVEKPESIELEGLCAVRSAKAHRLKRIKKGFYNPPTGRPIFVPGMHWLSVLLVGQVGRPLVVAMKWWTSRGEFASDRRTQEKAVLDTLWQQWGRRVIHVWDRGYAGKPWLTEVLNRQLRFILRWPKGWVLQDDKGPRLTWQICRGKRSWQYRNLWDARRRCERKTGIWAGQVTHPKLPLTPLWLVVARCGAGRSPWYLLTSEPITSPDEAWEVVLAYARRWQIEMAFRFTKSELAIQSPRLWAWANRLKLLYIVTLVYAFLLSLLDEAHAEPRLWLLRHFCHRTGKRYQVALIPLYRLRSALSRLWLSFPVQPSFIFQNSG